MLYMSDVLFWVRLVHNSVTPKNFRQGAWESRVTTQEFQRYNRWQSPTRDANGRTMQDICGELVDVTHSPEEPAHSTSPKPSDFEYQCLLWQNNFTYFTLHKEIFSLHFSANFRFTISNYYPESQVTPSTWSQYLNLYLCHMIANRIPVQKIHGNCRDWGFLHPEVEDFHSQKPSAEDICLSHPDPGTKRWNIVIAISYSYPYYSVIIHNLHCSN